MKSGYNITWSDEALKNLDDIFNYLEANFSQREIRRFARKLDKTITAIGSQPDAFSVLEIKIDRSQAVRTLQADDDLLPSPSRPARYIDRHPLR